MSGLEKIFTSANAVASVLTKSRKKELLSLQNKVDLPFENLLTTIERNKAKRAKRFNKAAVAEFKSQKQPRSGSTTPPRSTCEPSSEMPFGMVMEGSSAAQNKENQSTDDDEQWSFPL